ncbi:NAD(P)-dependent oxidoreductase [Acinetobacter baumannii]
MNIAFIGVGNMGSRMAARLIEAGNNVVVFDPNIDAVNKLVELGGSKAISPEKAATDVEFILLSLPNPKILEQAICGEDGILRSAKEGAVVIDFSTVDPETTKKMAQKCADRKVEFMDSPVSGGVIGAETGKLVLMIGGATETIEKSKNVLNEISLKIVHCGEVGTGQLTKLSHNLLTAINTVALGEVLTASVKAGANLNVLCEVFTAGLAGSKMLDYFPKTFFTEERPANFAIDLMHKDISLCLNEFSNYSMPLGQIVLQIYNAARLSGLGKKDSTSVNELYESLFDIRLNQKN